ncbi:MAG: YmfQ family protein [Lachnospiraceae bacterium]|nr:YmfQ family protein [Lachnospiraceae bacterium]
MTRDVNLVNYLPIYLQDYKETAATLEAENPEFVLVWNAADSTLNNRFIATADEYGISRYEDVMSIEPKASDDLETRRTRVLTKWLTELPYTMKMLLQKLVAICGGTDFTVSHNFETGYTMTIVTNLESEDQISELETMLEEWIPVNIVYAAPNKIDCNSDESLIMGGCVSFCEMYTI